MMTLLFWLWVGRIEGQTGVAPVVAAEDRVSVGTLSALELPDPHVGGY